MLSDEQTPIIKKQLITQLEKTNLSNKQEIKQAINSMNKEQLEAFLKQNKIQISKSPSQQNQTQQDKCIFCEIAKASIPSYKIAENKKAIAVLEINPLSKGHSLVIPIEHVSIEKISSSALTLSKKIAKKLKSKLKPSDIKIETTSIQEHPVINIIPIYKNEKLEKKKTDEQELLKLQEKLSTKSRTKRTSKPKQIDFSKLPEIKRRIP